MFFVNLAFADSYERTTIRALFSYIFAVTVIPTSSCFDIKEFEGHVLDGSGKVT